mgnify:CR=1 FL=1
MILQFSLLSALTCSVAIVLHSFDFKEATTWAICSGLCVVLQALGLRGVIQTMRGVEMTKSFRRLAVVLQIPTLIMILVNIMNASDIYFHREAGPVIATAVYALSIAAFMFSRLLLIPVWRNVRIQEAAKLANAAAE